jgi:hypothetical protein
MIKAQNWGRVDRRGRSPMATLDGPLGGQVVQTRWVCCRWLVTRLASDWAVPSHGTAPSSLVR